MIISLQNTYPEKLGKMEGSMGVVWNSLGRRNRIKFAVELGVGGMGIGRIGGGMKGASVGRDS